MYRPPISGGRDAIGLAIGGAVAAGSRDIAAGLNERYRRDLEEEERRRRERLEEEARLERERERQIREAQLGVISEAEAYRGGRPLQRATPGQAAPGAVIQVERADPIAGVMWPPETEARPELREGVVRAGGMYIDPRRSLAYQQAQIARQDEVAAQKAETERRAAALQAANPEMDPDDVYARAMGLSTTEPITWPEELSQREDILELERRYRPEYGPGGTRGMTPGQARALTTEQGEGLAMTAALQARKIEQDIAAGRARPGPGWDPIANVRVNIRQMAKANGVELSEPDVQRLAVEAYRGVQDQENQVRRMEQSREVERLRQQAISALQDPDIDPDAVAQGFARATGTPLSEAYDLLGLEYYGG